jgi:hypothetical protein
MPGRKRLWHYPNGREMKKGRHRRRRLNPQLTMPPRFPPHPVTRRASISYNIAQAGFTGDCTTRGDAICSKTTLRAQCYGHTCDPLKSALPMRSPAAGTAGCVCSR